MEDWELWESDDGGTTFFPSRCFADQERHLGTDPKLVWRKKFASYNEAMQGMYDHYGWGEYVPIEE